MNRFNIWITFWANIMAFTVGRPFIVFRHLNKSKNSTNCYKRENLFRSNINHSGLEQRKNSEYKLIHFYIVTFHFLNTVSVWNAESCVKCRGILGRNRLSRWVPQTNIWPQMTSFLPNWRKSGIKSCDKVFKLVLSSNRASIWLADTFVVT